MGSYGQQWKKNAIRRKEKESFDSTEESLFKLYYTISCVSFLFSKISLLI